ncbi:MAG: lipopolysaccharide biosynthesis protein [Clostridia bacterium]|nr:lipopolysaccharide biosynthesis protein [Clostridia bacterium]
MNDNALKKQTVSGVFWKFAENGLGQIVNFIISIVLARLLLPEDYGIIALVSVFVTLCDKLVISGLATSLIQKKDADNKDFSTIFYFSLGMSFVLYAVLYFLAPFIADFYSAYNRELLISVIRVMGIQVIVTAVNSVQSAYVSNTMQFKRFFWSNLGGMILSAVVGIIMALRGFGVWALVAQYLVKATGSMLVLWFTVKWRPSLVFSLKRFKALYSYGWKIFAASIIKVLYNDLRSLVIGKYYNAASLAYYNKGQSFPQIVEGCVGGAIDSVFFPTMSKVQDSKEKMLSILRRTIKVSTYFITPLLVGLAAVAEPLVDLLLTEKWLPCVFYLQIISISFVFAPIEIENLQAIKALGRSDIVLKLEIIKRVVGTVLIFCAVPFGVKVIAISLLVGNILSSAINAYPNRKLLGYSYRRQFLDVLPPMIMSTVMFFAVRIIMVLDLSNVVLLAIQIFTGLVVYVLMSIVTKNESYIYVLSIIKSFLKKKV